MPNISSATSYFPKSYENTVPMTLGGSVLAGAATVPVNGMTNYTDGDVICFVVDGATPALKQVFTGTKSGSNIINAVWTEFPTGGVNVAHSAGATVIDYVSATHWALFQKGITQSLNQDGSLKTTAVQTALNITGGAAGGWTPTGFAPSAVVANGNRSYNLTFAAADLTATLSAGMRLRTTRTVAAPTQCTSLNGTTQYYSKASPTGMAQTDSITEYIYCKLTSYAQGGLISRNNGTTDGWKFYVNASGQVILAGARVADDLVTSYQSIPLNKWVHISASINTTTTTGVVTIDGVTVPSSYTNNANTGFAVPTQSLLIGATNGASPTDFFPGKIAQAASFSAVITPATVLTYISQGLAGTETSLISAYSFNNSINDLNANANNLTANGSAVATNADSPFGGQAGGAISSTLDYAIVTAASFSTNTTLTVQVPEGCTIPTSGGVSAVSYATGGIPYGFPKQTGKWRISSLHKTSDATTSNATYGSFQSGGWALGVPIGEWVVGWGCGSINNNTATTVVYNLSPTALTGLGATAVDTTFAISSKSPAAASSIFGAFVRNPQSVSVFSTYVLYSLGATTSTNLDGTISLAEIFAENAYL